MIAASHQPALSNFAEVRSQPLLTVSAMRALLRKHEDEVGELIDAGLIRFALNLKSPTARKPEWRVLHAALDDYQRGASVVSPNVCLVPDLATAIDLMIPHHRETVRVSELAFHWVCLREHVYSLCGDEVPLMTLTGPVLNHETGVVTRKSVVDFLRTRINT